MSTTIEVYPARSDPPSFRQVIERAQIELWRFLERRAGIDSKPTVSVAVLQKETQAQAFRYTFGTLFLVLSACCFVAL